MSIVIENPLVLEQLKKVLRMQKGDVIAVQSTTTAKAGGASLKYKAEKEDVCRYVVRIDDWDHQRVYGTITETVEQPKDLGPSVTMYIAMPNKRDKAELIAQKLAELGVAGIVFWRGERSVLRDMNEKKVARIQKIIREAVEQSWGWYMPTLSFLLTKDFVIDEHITIFDTQDDPYTSPIVEVTEVLGGIAGVVGPEGGLTQRDYDHFPDHVVSSLGNTILRMETAAIVGAYTLLSSY